METTNKTVLITGGGSGIGFQIAKLFSAIGSKVIITGRNEDKLKSAADKLQNAAYFAADITKEDSLDTLVAFITENYPSLDILINNAGNASVYRLTSGAGAFAKASEEIAANYLSVINLTEKLLPLLDKQPEAALVNVTSIVALAPSIKIPTYSASKAALHSYTQALRLTLEKDGSKVKVFELLPPLVNTEFAKEIGGEEHGIAPGVVALDLLKAFENNLLDVRVGITEGFYSTFFTGSENAVAALYKAEGGE